MTLALLTSGCATTALNDRTARESSVMLDRGIAIVVDACIYRQNPPLVSNVFLKQESTDAARAILQNMKQRLELRGIRVIDADIPYVCGSLAYEPPVKPRVAERLGAPGVASSEFPVVLPTARQLAPDEVPARKALMQLAAESLREPRPARTRRVLTTAQARALAAGTRSTLMLVVVARGASIAGGLAATDVVMGLLLGGGGCRLGEDECDYRSTTHEGARADALLLDLEHPELGPRLGRPVDIGSRKGLSGDLDPLLLPPYAETAWADALLKSLDLPERPASPARKGQP